MRIGFNPNKDKKIVKGIYTHQIIIPVYIPNSENYFKDSFKIFKISLESLIITSHKKTFITIVNNGSCSVVVNYLNKLFEEKIIQEVIHTTSVGKTNAIYKGLAGSNFPLVTITDADVLFTHNWQQECYLIFENFKKVGVICTTPSSKSFNTHTSNVWFENLFNKKMMFSKVLNKQALLDFAKSIGNKYFYNKHHLNKYLTIEKNNVTAVVGAGHFVSTYRRDVFENLEQLYSEFSLGGISETIMLDIPVLRKGYWRLSTQQNYTWHLGNVFELWMKQKIDELKNHTQNNSIDFFLHKPKTQTNLMYFVKSKLAKKIIFNKKILKKLMQFKGLGKEEVKQYK